MKNKFLFILIAAAGLMLASCQNELKQSVSFDVVAQADGGSVSGNSITVNAGSPVLFNFTGDPDFITFYSGEPGREYSKKNLFEVPADEITSVLKFENMPQYGTIPNTLKLKISTDFTGIKGAPNANKTSDSTMIATHAWTDISDLANFSTGSNKRQSSEIPLNEYLGKKLTIAFEYDPKQNTATQPTWVITHLRIENTNTVTGEVTEIKAATMGFKVLDMFSATPYKSDGGAGVWDLRTIAEDKNPAPFGLRIGSSPSGNAINHDWVVSNPILINSRPADKGVAIKKMSEDMDSYTYTFNSPGTYTVTFVARNSNFEHLSEAVKEFTVTVN